MFKYRKYLAPSAVLVAGCLLLIWGLSTAAWYSPQIRFYNQAMQSIAYGDCGLAEAQLDQSLQDFESRRMERASIFARIAYPGPDLEVAVLAHFHKGKCFIDDNQIGQGVMELEDAIRMIPEAQELYAPVIERPEKNYHRLANLSALLHLRKQEEPAAVKSDRLVELLRSMQYDLEWLYSKHADMIAQQLGKSKKDGHESKRDAKQVPGMAPGAMPGKGGAESI
jgi:hypothetical protein